MSDVSVKTLDGDTTTIDAETLEGLAAALRGDVLTPDSLGYDDVRTLWNGMIDKRPGLIVSCSGAADVRRAVDLARDRGLLTAVRGGGHNIAGNAVCDGGLMIDLSPMKQTRVDPATRTARVGPGATLGDFDHECQAFALATPVGINSTTGIAGLTLGGGFGWLTRKHGLTVDNLLSADVVTADGELVVASEENHPDLFWAIRGGGGNFGVVTSFEFQLHEFGPEVLSGLIVFPFDEARSVLQQYRDLAPGHPDELVVWVVTRQAPPLPFLPEEVHGKEVLVLPVFWADADMEAGERAIAPLRDLGSPVGEHVVPHPYAGWQQAFDPLLTPGARNYWKSHDFTEISDDAIDVLLEYAGKLPSPECEIFIGQVGGAMRRVPADATAYPHRDVEFIMNVHGRWQEASQDDECIGWAREFFEKMAPHSTGSVYVNFMTADESERVRNAYGPSYDRLVEIKQEYDPDNLFRLNQNIRP